MCGGWEWFDIAMDTHGVTVPYTFPAHDLGYVRPMGGMQVLKNRQHNMLLAGRSVIDLSMVNPDLAPPRSILDRLLESVNKPGAHRYSVSRGVRKLREAFVEKYSSTFHVQLDPEEQVCVCLGSKDATYHALRALVGPGDRVIVTAPAYPAHLSALHLVGAHPVLWEPDFRPEVAGAMLRQLIDSSGACLVLCNFPCNPTGAVVSREWWRALIEGAHSRRVYVLNDFVYGEMVFGAAAAAPSALEVAPAGMDRVLEVYSLSKAYSVPGWRVGALVGDAGVVREVGRQKAIADYGVFLPIQFAAEHALTATEDIVRPTVRAYERRIRLIVQGLARAGWEVTEPKAGASVWAKIPSELYTLAADSGLSGVSNGGSVKGSVKQSLKVAEFLLERAGVLCCPGMVFGDDYDCFLRFAAVAPEEQMRDVISALGGLR
jgi:alanine-synthesizing transaminase